MRLNKKAILSGYTSLQFAIMILILLILFTVIISTIHNDAQRETRASESQRAADVTGSIEWSPGWLANSYTNYRVRLDETPVPLGLAIAYGLPQEDIDERFEALRLATSIGEKYFIIFVIRDHELLYCDGKNLAEYRGQTIGFCGEVAERIQRPDYGLLALKESLRERKNMLSWTVTPGEQETVIGVVVA